MSQEAVPAVPSADAWTIKRVLEWTTQHLAKHGSESPRLEAEILLAHARKYRRIQLYTNYDEVLTDAVRGQMRELVQRRAKKEPVAYLVGYREFFSLEFRVTPDVLIPRPDTETLVMEALAVAKLLSAPRLLDLCTGSGCVVVSLAKQLPTATLAATDLSAAALQVARENAAKHKVADRVSFYEGDLFVPLPADAKYDAIVSNPPYIARAELDTLEDDIRKYEPRGALDGGEDGLDFLRRILTDAPAHLSPQGWVLLELSPEQADRARQFAESLSVYEQVALVKDLSGQPRVLRARLT